MWSSLFWAISLEVLCLFATSDLASALRKSAEAPWGKVERKESVIKKVGRNTKPKNNVLI